MTDKIPNYIESSRKLWPWLKAQGVVIEVDEYAPVVFFDTLRKEHIIGQKCWTGYKYICPFFGPGGADNCLKALRGWYDLQLKKRIVVIPLRWDVGVDERGFYLRWLIDIKYGKGKTDGIALHDLLLKIATEEK